jgi:hypothetical protein
MYFKIGPHHVVVIHSPVRLDSLGVIALLKVETLSVCIVTSFCPKYTAHFQKIHFSCSLNDVI